MSRHSKFLSLILRHKPEEAGLTLDPQGWAEVQAVLKGCRAAGRPMTRDMLVTLVASSDKQRFTFSEDGRWIRAAQGHSVPVDLGLAPQTPPPMLYHGTARSSLDAIFSEGLTPQGRAQVHLSFDPETARLVGQRHGCPVVLTVATGRMQAEGHVFFCADNGVWLTDRVPRLFLGFHS